MASINSYNGSFGSILAKIEAVEGTAETPTAAANTIPVFQATPTIDLGFSMENPALEDMSGTKYLGQVTVAKCSWSMEMPIYGDGESAPSVLNVPRYVSQILATAFEVDTSPTSIIALRPLITTATNNTNCSFTLVGYFGLKGSPAGGAKLKALLSGCKIGKATFTLKSDGIHRLKLEGLGVYNSNWSDSTDNLSGNNWDAAANQFIRGTGQALTLNDGAGAVAANVTSTEIAIDFGADYILTDGALSTVGVGGIGYTKRDITFTIDPIWAPTASYNIYSQALAGGSFEITSAIAYPAAFSGQAGYGLVVYAPFVQFAGSTPDRGVAVRQKLSGMAVKSVENTDPLTISII
jgi:hypothetical protein